MPKPAHYRLLQQQFLRTLLAQKTLQNRASLISNAAPGSVRALQEFILNFGNWVGNHQGLFPLSPKHVQQVKHLAERLCNHKLSPKAVKNKILKRKGITHRFSNLEKIGLLLDIQKNYAPTFLR